MAQVKYALHRRWTFNWASLGSQINEMPAFSVCVCWLIGQNVKTAMSIFHTRMTKAAYLGKQRGAGSVLQIRLEQPQPCLAYYFSLYGSGFCFTEDLKSKLSPGWKQDLVVVSHNLNDTDYSCFVKLYAEVITKWQTTRGYSNYPLMVLKRGSGCKLFRGDLRTASECFVWRLQPCPILHPKSITFPSWIALLGL